MIGTERATVAGGTGERVAREPVTGRVTAELVGNASGADR